jgi:putative spermidine/putrescine transport system permease protein
MTAASWPARYLLRVWVLGVAAFVLAPLVTIVSVSFSTNAYIVFPPKGVTLKWYADAFGSDAYMGSLGLSLVLAVAVVAIALLLGLPAAFAIVRYRFPGQGLLKSLIVGPLFVPSVFLALAFLVFYIQVGIGQTSVPILLGHVVIVLPFIVRFVSVGLATSELRALEHAAATLGAGQVSVLRRVTFPMIRPALIAGSLIAFTVSFDETVIALFFATPKVTTLPVRILGQIEFNAADTSITAVASLLLVLSFVAVVLVDRFYGLDRALIGAGRD